MTITICPSSSSYGNIAPDQREIAFGSPVIQLRQKENLKQKEHKTQKPSFGVLDVVYILRHKKIHQLYLVTGMSWKLPSEVLRKKKSIDCVNCCS